MVLRDKNRPTLEFDNPIHTSPRPPPPLQGRGGPGGGGGGGGGKKIKEDPKMKKELEASRSVGFVPRKKEHLDNRTSNLSHGPDLYAIFAPTESSTENRSTENFARPQSATPESDFEEHIMENIRNRDFWSRRSRNNPFFRLRRGGERSSVGSLRASVLRASMQSQKGVRASVQALSTRQSLSPSVSGTPQTLQVPFLYPDLPQEEMGEAAGGEDEEEEVDEEIIASEMMKEVQREARLRENITWIRNYLTECCERDGGSFSLSSFVSTMRNKELLHRLFSLWDVRGDGVLLQEEWVDHLKCSTSVVGAREWAELLEVLAYVVCGEDAEVTQDHFTTIITSRGVLEKLYHLVNKDGVGLVTRQEIMDFIANLTYARPRTGFTRENLEWLEELFRQALGHKQELTFDDFKKIVHSRNSFFAERVFQIFDRDNSGSVSLSEFLDAMHQFAGKSPNDKIKFLFRVYDLDGDGLIQQSELQKVMKACMEENGMKFSDDQIEDLTLAMFEDADTQKTGAITYESLKAQLEKHDGLLENLSISIDRWLVPPNLGKEKPKNCLQEVSNLRPYQLSVPYLKNNYVYLIFLFIYLGINLGLFVSRSWEYRESNGYTIVARACGQCLNFNCMFVLVLMLRQCITYLRSMGASSFLPLDQHMYLHKLCGWLIFGYSLLHTIMHLLNFGLNIIWATDDGEVNEEEWEYWEWILTMRPGLFGLIPGIANPTGVALMVILTVMVICSLPFVRKSGCFEVFYWTHLLYIAFWGLCILHGPNFWKWFVAPGIIFLIERIHRTIRMRTGRGKTYISSGVLLPSKVIHLVIKRPVNFHFHPGDYVFINIPEIAKYEWHPFTISSAPEQDDVLWLHIRAVGQWTNRLYSYFEREQEKCERERVNLSLSPATAISTPQGVVYQTVVGDARANPGVIRSVPPRLALENGVLNAAFDGDSERDQDGGLNGAANVNKPNRSASPRPFATSPSSPNLLPTSPASGSSTPSPQASPKPKPNRRKLKKTRSVPDLNKKDEKREIVMLRDTSRSNSLMQLNEASLRQAKMAAIGAPSSPSSHTHAMSFKYIRRKPTIICLDLPSETESCYGEDGSESEMAEVRLSIEDSTMRAGEDRDLSPVAMEEGRKRRVTLGERETGERERKREERRKSRQEERRARKRSRMEEVLAEGGCAVGKPLVIYMDGPFGAPSSHIFRAQHAVLIATGIGVTPFASILQSIMHKYWKARHVCPQCSYSWSSDLPRSVMNLRKVDFFWINRDQRSFEWFVNLLSQLEIEQAEQGGVLERFLDMHMYITSALQKTDMKAVGLQLALDLLHEKEKRDLITGLKTRTNAGRPNWDKVFKQLSNQGKGKITVFYCGPPALGRTLRYKCDEFGFDFRKEIF